MRNTLALVLVSLLVSACGNDFTGTYEGLVSFKLTCDSTLVEDSASNLTIKLVDEGSRLKFEADNCPGLAADISGSTAELREKTCPPQTLSNGTIVTITYTSGTMELDGNALKIDWNSNVRLEGSGGSGTCTAKTTGTLTRD